MPGFPHSMWGRSQVVYGAGVLLFGVSAYFYRISVKYMVKIGTPVPNGYRVTTLCTHGPFQYFQHPIYTALLGCSLSTPLVLDCACTPSPSPAPSPPGCGTSALPLHVSTKQMSWQGRRAHESHAVQVQAEAQQLAVLVCVCVWWWWGGLGHAGKARGLTSSSMAQGACYRRSPSGPTSTSSLYRVRTFT